MLRIWGLKVKGLQSYWPSNFALAHSSAFTAAECASAFAGFEMARGRIICKVWWPVTLQSFDPQISNFQHQKICTPFQLCKMFKRLEKLWGWVLSCQNDLIYYIKWAWLILGKLGLGWPTVLKLILRWSFVSIINCDLKVAISIFKNQNKNKIVSTSQKSEVLSRGSQNFITKCSEAKRKPIVSVI